MREGIEMKITIDVSPDEMRKLLGWPDVQGIQEQAISKILEQMNAGAEGYDPMSLMKPFFAQSAASMEMFQKIMTESMAGFSNNSSDSSDSG